MKVAVCMASYNGSKFIKKQIMSILNQTYSSFDLFIRDDYSKDDTASIISSIDDPRIKLVTGPACNIGYKANFQFLMSITHDYDLVFFSDQDDIWKDNKIDEFVKYIKQNKIDCKQELYLLYSNYDLIDANNMYLSTAFPNNHTSTDMHRSFVQNEILGCTMAITNALLERTINIPDASPSHDDWIALVASIDGNIVYFNDSYISHRIHAKNATTKQDTTKLGNRLKRVCNRFLTNKKYIARQKKLYQALINTVNNKSLLREIYEILYFPRIRAYKLAKKYNFAGVNDLQTKLFLLQILLK